MIGDELAIQEDISSLISGLETTCKLLEFPGIDQKITFHSSLAAFYEQAMPQLDTLKTLHTTLTQAFLNVVQDYFCDAPHNYTIQSFFSQFYHFLMALEKTQLDWLAAQIRSQQQQRRVSIKVKI